LLYLFTRGVGCHDLDVFWDRDGVFYLGHSQVILNNYNLSIDNVALMATKDFAAIMQSAHLKPNATKGLLTLSELVEMVSTHHLGPISLELQATHSKEYFDRFAELYSFLVSLPIPARVAVSIFRLEDVEELRSRLKPGISVPSRTTVALALTLKDPGSEVSINLSAVSPSALAPFGVISASWKLWEAKQFASSLSNLHLPVLARNIDHRDYFRFRDMMMSDAVPEYLVTNEPLGLSRRLKAECDANPAADDLRERLENRFFLIWSNALPRSILFF